MTRHWTGAWARRAVGSLLVAGTTLLAACGSGSVISDLKAERFITLGDGFMDVGQTGSLYTVNDGSLNWVQQFALYYGLTVEPAAVGGTGFAQGHARVIASGEGVPSVSEQVDALLAGAGIGANDVVLINGGASDIVAAVEEAVAAGVAPENIVDATASAVEQAAKDLAAQVRRVVDAGAKYVLVMGVHNLGHTPWARQLDLQPQMEQLSITGRSGTSFNATLLLEVADLWKSVRYYDVAQFFNFIHDKPSAYPVDNITDAVCMTPDASTCTPDTVRDANYNQWLFADDLHFTPAAQRLMADERYLENVYTFFKSNW